jgi:hypothetical protein
MCFREDYKILNKILLIVEATKFVFPFHSLKDGFLVSNLKVELSISLFHISKAVCSLVKNFKDNNSRALYVRQYAQLLLIILILHSLTYVMSDSLSNG